MVVGICGLAIVLACNFFSPPVFADDLNCSGYIARNVRKEGFQLEADLGLLANCDTHGPDVPKLSLSVTYETGKRLGSSIFHNGEPTVTWP